MAPDPVVYVAQTAPAFFNHFYRVVAAANEYPGPALLNVYATCPPEHGVADDAGARQARLAVEARAFPLFEYDPRRGPAIAQRLSLKGNPGAREDWHLDPHTGKSTDFVDWARTEGRFRHHSDSTGLPSPELLAARQERLGNWRRLRELSGERLHRDRPGAEPQRRAVSSRIRPSILRSGTSQIAATVT